MPITHAQRPRPAPGDAHPSLADAFFAGAPIGFAILRMDDVADPGSFRPVSLNEAARRIGSVPPDALEKRMDEIPAIAASDFPARFAEVLRTNTPLVLGNVAGAFEPSRYFAGYAFPIPPDCVGIIYLDVTERRHSERQLEHAQQLARMGSWTWSTQDNQVRWSDQMYRIYGLSRETFKATFEGFLECVHPADRAMVEASVRSALEHGEAFHHQERIIRPDGDVRVLDSVGECVLDAAGKPVQLVGLCRDITDDARAVRALQESEQRFRKIFEASPAAICVFEPATGRLLDANPRFVELVGYGAIASLVGRRLDTLGMWTEPGEYDRLIERLRATRSLRETMVTYRTYGGQVRRALVALELMEIDGKESALGLFWRA